MKINKSALITGVSTGIGLSIAEKFLDEGFLVFGSIRKPEDAETLKNKYGESFIPLVFDVTIPETINESVKIVESKLAGKNLGVLVNNAGIAKGGPLLYVNMQDIRNTFEVNVFGVIHVIRAFAPLLGATEKPYQNPGKIINISSVSGIFASPFVAPYVGSKHALEGISGSLRRELMLFGIDVIVIGPGVVKTPIWGKGGDISKYDNTPYKSAMGKFRDYIRKNLETGLEVEKISDVVYKVAIKDSPKTRYGIVPNYFTNNILRRIIPTRTMDKLIGKMMGLVKG